MYTREAERKLGSLNGSACLYDVPTVPSAEGMCEEYGPFTPSTEAKALSGSRANSDQKWWRGLGARGRSPIVGRCSCSRGGPDLRRRSRSHDAL